MSRHAWGWHVNEAHGASLDHSGSADPQIVQEVDDVVGGVVGGAPQHVPPQWPGELRRQGTAALGSHRSGGCREQNPVHVLRQLQGQNLRRRRPFEVRIGNSTAWALGRDA